MRLSQISIILVNSWTHLIFTKINAYGQHTSTNYFEDAKFLEKIYRTGTDVKRSLFGGRWTF